MALRIRYVKRVCGRDVVFEEAYVEIIQDGGDKSSRSINVAIYDDLNKRNMVDFYVYYFPADVSDGSDNFYKQGYLYLKTLPEYAEAIDC